MMVGELVLQILHGLLICKIGIVLETIWYVTVRFKQGSMYEALSTGLQTGKL